jgi:hypothetical protein
LTDAATATLVTGAAFAGEWLAIAGTQAAAMTQTLAAVLSGDDSFGDGVRSALDAYGNGLRQMALLPRTYGLRFFQELQQTRSGPTAVEEPPAPEPRRAPRARRRARPRRRRR